MEGKSIENKSIESENYELLDCTIVGYYLSNIPQAKLD